MYPNFLSGNFEKTKRTLRLKSNMYEELSLGYAEEE
jgi:hypothetical protein